VSGELGATPLAFGRCIICIIANSSRETIAALQNCGVLFKRNSAQSLAENLQHFIDNANKVEELGNKAFELAVKIYNWDIPSIQYEDVFCRVLKFK
jgi:glycosyltransferase involved in cell wall biosynthesis